jgi:transcriptional regulator with XRE-family HTH domain
MQEVDSELRALMQAKKLDQAGVARRSKVSQATVSRALMGGAPKRRGKAYLRLCKYIQEQKTKNMFPTLDRSQVHEAINRIWEASKLHADAIAKVVEAMDDCAHRR